MAAESKTAIKYCAKTMKKPIFLHKSVFCEKKMFMVSASFLDDRIVQRWKFVGKNGISQIHYCRKIWLFVILASRPRKLLMVSASFWTTKSCKTEICQKSGTRQIQVCRETKALCNTCKQAEKTVYGLSFTFGQHNRAETDICEKNPTEDIVKI